MQGPQKIASCHEEYPKKGKLGKEVATSLAVEMNGNTVYLYNAVTGF